MTPARTVLTVAATGYLRLMIERMHRPVRLTGLGLLVLFLTIPVASLADDESQPGLVATYSDGTNSVVRIVPTVSFRLRHSESIHPQIDSQFSAEWNGLLQIDRAGDYRVFADGAAVEVNGTSATESMRLSTGLHPVRIRFERTAADAKLNLLWQSDFFRTEPVPSAVLRHVNTPADIAVHDTVEHGRFLFAELGCANCHAAGNWNLQSRRGPDLTHAGSRITAGWLYEWLKNPHQYRKSAVMPVCLDSDQDRADVTTFVISLTSASSVAVSDAPNHAQQQAGRELFEQVGCAKCHDKNNNLDAVGSKYLSAGRLADFIANPHAIDPHGRMPQVFQPGTERHLAGTVAGFLFHTNKLDQPYPDPPPGDASRGARLFASSGCASCHAVISPAVTQQDALAGPAFGQPAGLPLRHFWDFNAADTPSVQDRVTGRKETVTGRTALKESVPSRATAFDFDGSTYVEVPHFHRPDTMTISVWVNTTQGGSLITWGRPGSGLRGSRELRMNIGQDGRNSVCYGEYNSDSGWRPVIAKPKNVNLVDGKWHHIAVVRDGESIQHFVDGKAIGGGRTHKGGGDYTDRLLIGALALQSNPSNRFKGMMDDLSIWEMALSAEQVAALAAGESALDMAAPQDVKVKPFRVDSGCLAADVKRSLPDYRLLDVDRRALQQFLTTVQPSATNEHHLAPAVLHDLRIRQFRCTACHELNDQNIQKGLAVDDNGLVVRVERPPLLTGAGAKLTTSWLRSVLLDRKRNRPWLNLRMPHFGEGVGDLPGLISASAGVSASDTDPTPDRSLADAGLEMIGVRRGKVACITCHDYRGINRRKDGVVPAPDLADAGLTVRHEWFDRWMHDPQRLQPGTSMPQLFLNVSAEERELRISQLWSALYYQKQLPLPKGVLDQQTEGTRIVVTDKPVIFRMATVTPVGQIDRAINVGIPGGLNFTFDPVTCRLRYAWKGEFLDAGPAWNGRGGNPVKAGNDTLVAVKSAHFVRIGDTSEPKSLRFTGYRLVNHMPVFRYTVDGARVEHRIDVTESLLVQSIAVHAPSGDVVYIGDSETKFASEAGRRESNAIRFPKDDVVEFEITIPVK